MTNILFRIIQNLRSRSSLYNNSRFYGTIDKINEDKDKKKLQSVSDYFTEDTIKNILCILHNGKKSEVIRWDFSEASAKGDSYLSTVNKIKVLGIVDNKEVQCGLVVKSLPKNLGRRKTYRSADFFHNEIVFYTKVLPKFLEFLENKGQNQVLSIPRHIASVADGNNDFLALEDVSYLGYGPINRQKYVDEYTCKMMVRTMARFHAVSFAYKDQKKEEFTEVMETIRETYFSKEHWSWYKEFHGKLIGVTKNALALEYPNSEAEKRYSSYKLGDLYHKAADFCSRKYASTSVINQGDSWAPNFLSRNINGKEDAIMLDFQLARCASPVLDLSFCIYTCTDKSLWDKKFDELLKYYYHELSSTISLLGSNPEQIYSSNVFMSEVKEQFMFGLVFAMEAIPFSLLEESEAFDLDALIEVDNAINIGDVWTVSNIKTKAGRLRLANVVVHAVEKGFL